MEGEGWWKPPGGENLLSIDWQLWKGMRPGAAVRLRVNSGRSTVPEGMACRLPTELITGAEVN